MCLTTLIPLMAIRVIALESTGAAPTEVGTLAEAEPCTTATGTGERQAPRELPIGSIMAVTGYYGGGDGVLRLGSGGGVITPRIDAGLSFRLAAAVLGVIASGRQVLFAERRGIQLSDRIADLAFLPLSFSAPLDLAERLRGTA